MPADHEQGRHRAPPSRRRPPVVGTPVGGSVPGSPWERPATDLSSSRWEAASANEPKPPWESRDPLPNPYERPISALPDPRPTPAAVPAWSREPADQDDEPEADEPSAPDEPVDQDVAPDSADPDGGAPHPGPEPEDEEPDEPAPRRVSGVAIGIGVGIGAGILVAAGSVAGIRLGLAGLVAAAVVIAVLTAVAVRRGIGGDWRLAGVLGLVAGLATAGRDLGPDWLTPLLTVYAAAVGGVAAILLTRPVRKLTSLVFEYGIAILCALAGAGAVAGILDGADMSRTVRAATIVAGVTVALVLAVGIRTRLTERETTTGEFVFIGLFVAAVIVAAAAVGVITGSGESSALSRLLDGIWGGVLLIALPFALLGVGTVVRVWTPAGWWICAPAATGAAMVAAVIGSDGDLVAGPILLGVLGGCLAGFLLTVLTALVVGMRMRAPSQRGKRQIWRPQDEPGRLAAL